MKRAVVSIAQVVVLSVVAAACSFLASPRILSGAALEATRGGVDCDCQGRNPVNCGIAPGKMMCSASAQRCNYDGTPKVHKCNPNGSSSSLCHNNVNCIDQDDDAISSDCTEVM